MGKMLSYLKEFVIGYVWGPGKEEITDASPLKPETGLNLLALPEVRLQKS